MSKTVAERIIPFLDFTSLNEDENEAKITAFAKRANTPYGPVAAICVYPQFVKTVQNTLPNSQIKIATVANFPTGNILLEKTLDSITQSIKTGAQEIDVVMPYAEYLSGNKTFAIDYIHACKETCAGDALLKVILETGAFREPDEIAEASKDMIEAGADFLKTSTGKIAIGATLEAAEIMLQVIQSADRNVGFKAAGGVATPEFAMALIEMTEKLMGKHWLSPNTFRIGASRLLDALLQDAK
jgi:deoxyribose-phosphate aldolase